MNRSEAVGVCLMLLLVATAGAAPVGTAFTYQGQLVRAGAPATGPYDMQFGLWDAPADGTQVGALQQADGVAVSNGLFTAVVDFGAGAFAGEARWLEIAVGPAGGGALTPLAPRQPLTATPYALHAAHAASAASVPAASIVGTLPESALPATVARLDTSPVFTGAVQAPSFSGNGSELTNLDLAAIGPAGTFGLIPAEHVFSSSPAVGFAPFALAAADVDGDGRRDLVTANYNASTLSVLRNNGSGAFTLVASPAVQNTPTAVAVADMNADGRMDLVSTHYNPNLLLVLLNNGVGGYTTTGPFSVGTRPMAVVAADLNGDGRVDLVSANQNANTLSVLLNNGVGGFTLGSSPAVGLKPRGLLAADVNGDGRVDLVSANYGANTLSVLLNNGSGGFSLAASPAVGAGPHAVAGADVNADGRIDLVSANYDDNTLTVLLNVGYNTFVSAGSPATGYAPIAVAVADIEGDGHMDLVSANQVANTLSVLSRDSGGAFALVRTLTVGSSPRAVALVDLNGDGVLDLASANQGDNTVSVLHGVPAKVAGHFAGNYVGDAGGLTNLPATRLTGTVDDARLSPNVALLNGAPRFTGVVTASGFTGSGVGITNIPASALDAGQVVKSLNTLHDNVTLVPGANVTITPEGNALRISAADGWSLTGNTGTTPASHFLGTVDNQALELRVGNRRALRVEPTTTGAPNLIGGFAGNCVSNAVVGATIAGGGNATATRPNEVVANYGTVGGGSANRAGYYATVSGGSGNLSTGDFAVVAGGSANKAAGRFATVGGGQSNEARGDAATVPGGYRNVATDNAMAAGRRAKALHPGSFVWGDTTEADVASTGDDQFVVRASGGSFLLGGPLTVPGGLSSGDASLFDLSVNGNTALHIDATREDSPAITFGCAGNQAATGALAAGGSAGTPNLALGDWSATIGGFDNTASGEMSAVLGGTQNHAVRNCSAVLAGVSNEADGYYATVTGGSYNTASGESSAVLGGYDNEASGLFAAVVGGYCSRAEGAGSLAAGQFAQAEHDGSFVWSDGSVPEGVYSQRDNEFRVHASGGVAIEGSLQVEEAVRAPNIPFAAYTQGYTRIEFAGGETKRIDTLHVTAPADGVLMITAFVNAYVSGPLHTDFTVDLCELRRGKMTWADLGCMPLVPVNPPIVTSKGPISISWTMPVEANVTYELYTQGICAGAEEASTGTHSLSAIFMSTSH